MSTLGQRMRTSAERAGFTQKNVGFALAKRIGRSNPYTEAAVGQWYSDKHEPEIAAILEFADMVNVDLVCLLIGRTATQEIEGAFRWLRGEAA